MVPDPVEQFIESLKRSGLVPEEELLSYSEEFKSSGIDSQEEIAAKLVEKNVLTPYQAERILQGQAEDCVLAERYHLLEKIGAGGMGNVFRALDTKLNRVVAIKLMTPHNLSDPDAVARFKREARALAQLALPNVVQAFDTGEDRGRNFLVMEFVQGIGLNQLVKDKGPVPPSVAADYIYQTALGMLHAHERGLIHRDIKPANLLLTGEGEIKILDLGLARFLQDQIPDGELTRENVGLGTPDYMSPEQFRDARNVDPRADIYSLGCTLYYLIAGQVPFPGSSLSEKAHAHENEEPPPLEERIPEIPVGLALVVYKMMAKRSSDRFQNMREVAEALAPYVAGSSKSLPSIKRTVSWHGSQLTTTRKLPAMWLPWAGGVGAVVAVLVLLILVLPGYWNRTYTPKNEMVAQTGNGEHRKDKSNDKTQGKSGNKNNKNEKGLGRGNAKPPIKKEPQVVKIFDGVTVAKDGTGEYKTINEALKHVEPGQQIVVLDDAVYKEVVTIDVPERQRGIRLEARKKATIELENGSPYALLIRGVPDVQVSGFRFREKNVSGENIVFAVVRGHSPGVILQKLDLQTQKKVVYGIALLNSAISASEKPIIVRNCHIDGGRFGIAVNGLANSPATGVVVAGNRIEKTLTGITIGAVVGRVQIAGNILWRNSAEAIQLDALVPGSGPVLIANNSCYNNRQGILVMDGPPHVPFKRNQVEFCNNLVFASDLGDMVFTKLTGREASITPSDGKFLLELWRFHHNGRDMAGGYGPKMVPLAKEDLKLAIQDFPSERDSSNSNFLRPAADSALATKGAGKTDPGFPIYIGAVPPEGTPKWNWKWTWDVCFRKTLTVSQDAKDEAQFKSINAALEKVQPGMTVRVLDKATYEERIVLQQGSRYAGITLEAVNGATIAPENSRISVKIEDVPKVTLRGFRLRARKSSKYLVLVGRESPGILVENLNLDSESAEFFAGIGIEQLTLTESDAPVIIKNCDILNAGIGVRISGMNNAGNKFQKTARFIICDCQIQGCMHAVGIMGDVRECLIAGNRIFDTSAAAILLGATIPEIHDITICHNTFFNCKFAFVIWDTKLQGKDLSFCHNLILSSRQTDMAYVYGSLNEDLPSKANDGNLIHKSKIWKLYGNWREGKKPTGKTVWEYSWIPPGKGSVLKEKIDILSRNPAAANFLRPAKDSKLATAAKSDESLPSYIGAVPPEGVEPWNWNNTWQMRMKKKKTSGKK